MGARANPDVPVRPASAPAPSLRSFDDFATAAEAVLQHLQHELGFRHWMITRTEGDDWIVLKTHKGSGSYEIHAGDVLRWSDSFCSRMVMGEGPRIAPRVKDVPAYATAPVAEGYEIAAYVGAPLVKADGSLFGTLCAIDPTPQPAEIAAAQPMVELFAQLLSTLLQNERRLEDEVRRRERAELEAEGDVLTGLLSRRGWQRILNGEEARCKRTGAPACVIVGDLDDLKAANDELGHLAGDELLLYAGRLIIAACRQSDIAARLGGDEFAILAPETTLDAGAALLERLRGVLDAADISMSLGIAPRGPKHDLASAWEAADRAMLAEKAERKRR
jgi:diguanylate cyclase